MVDLFEPIDTYWDLYSRNSLNQLTVSSLKPYRLSLLNRISWLMQSNALDSSMVMIVVIELASVAMWIASVIWSRAVVVL